MGKAFLGTMGVAYPIESINRKLALRSEKSSEKKFTGRSSDVELPSVKYMGGFTRKYRVTTGSNKVEVVTPQYMFVRKNARSSAITTTELQLRNRFRSVSQGVATIMEDLMQLTTVQQMFLAARADITKTCNGVSMLGYATIRAWVFAVQYAGLKADETYNVDEFPQAFD